MVVSLGSRNGTIDLFFPHPMSGSSLYYQLKYCTFKGV